MRHFVRILTLLAVLAFGAPCFGQEAIVKVKNPAEVRAEYFGGSSSVPKEIEGLQWNRWTSKNFVVCSLDDTQAQYLHKHLELVKGWAFARWGLMDLDFSAECKVIVVDRPELFKKLFNIDSTRVEVRRDSSTGKITSTVIFLLCNDSPSKIVPIPLTQVCMAEFAQRYNAKVGTWAYRGMAQLNGTIPQIKDRVVAMKPVIDRNEPLFFSKGLMEMDVEQYGKLDAGKQRLYDDCAMLFCLLVRKEHGQDKYLKLMKRAGETSPEAALKEVLGFTDYDHFDRTMKRYIIDLTRDVSAGKTPDHYLQIREKK